MRPCLRHQGLPSGGSRELMKLLSWEDLKQVEEQQSGRISLPRRKQRQQWCFNHRQVGREMLFGSLRDDRQSRKEGRKERRK